MYMNINVYVGILALLGNLVMYNCYILMNV